MAARRIVVACPLRAAQPTHPPKVPHSTTLLDQAPMTTVETEYARHVRELTGTQRVQVAAAMIDSLRSAYELQVLSAEPQLVGEALRVAVARRMYRHDPRAMALLRSLEPEG